MSNYELTVIFKVDAQKEGLEVVKKEIEAVKGKIEKQEDLGVKDLAYEIKKEPKGHYVFYNVSLDPLTVNDLEKSMHLKNQLLKLMFVKA